MKNLGCVFTMAALVLVAGCGKNEEVPLGRAAEGVAAESGNVLGALDSLGKDLASDTFNSQSGALADGRLSNSGKDGYLLFGPYVAFKAGTYTVTFVGEVGELPVGAKVRLDVDSNKGRRVYGGVDATAVGALPQLEFTLSNDVSDLEVRVLTQGGATVSLSSYSVAKKS
ncbi:hypothetical protein [Pseudoxanthomonas sp.]|uniref:hypothetical protein n=1 Tax=Pseudoxanthomonas sp. TaxID=1871049 RepID=UPI00260D0DEE|nr:hypothetical protein [Pseudoxanthomonas sp.]WDS35640.1 MAG: hypothetical protein O8I58_15085 [Pseudoxanthomonas sp.]